jgi:p24 family protein delta-1
VETELRRIEETVNEIVQEMEYLRLREQKLRDTNESTNERVKWFSLGTMGMLVGLGAWQVVYLRAYFRFVLCFHENEYVLTGDLGRSISSRS